MSVHTRTCHTKSSKKKVLLEKKTARSIPWREVAKESIEKYGEVGLAIKGSRVKSGLTQKKLADALGILPHHISEMEHGKRAITRKMAIKLAEVMNVNYKIFL